MRRSDEPIYWGLFGAGGMVVAMLLPVIVLITGLLVPMGIMDVETMSYERALEFASS
ncbi:fumarate reductase subunit FrdD, partial [Aeromonas hydrophila]